MFSTKIALFLFLGVSLSLAAAVQDVSWILPSSSDVKCLTAISNQNLAAVVIEDCNGSPNQKWTIAGTNIVAFNDECLDNGHGIPSVISQCVTGNSNQTFTVVGQTITLASEKICLDLTDGSLLNGNQVQVLGCSGSAHQAWNIVHSAPTPPPPAQLIHPAGEIGECLTVSSNTGGAAVEIEDCVAGSAAQQWTFLNNAFTIFGDQCLDGGDNSNPNGLQIFSCAKGNFNQQWMLSNGVIAWTGKRKCLEFNDGGLCGPDAVGVQTCTSADPLQQWIATPVTA